MSNSGYYCEPERKEDSSIRRPSRGHGPASQALQILNTSAHLRAAADTRSLSVRWRVGLYRLTRCALGSQVRRVLQRGAYIPRVAFGPPGCPSRPQIAIAPRPPPTQHPTRAIVLVVAILANVVAEADVLASVQPSPSTVEDAPHHELHTQRHGDDPQGPVMSPLCQSKFNVNFRFVTGGLGTNMPAVLGNGGQRKSACRPGTITPACEAIAPAHPNHAKVHGQPPFRAPRPDQRRKWPFIS